MKYGNLTYRTPWGISGILHYTPQNKDIEFEMVEIGSQKCDLV